MEKCETKKLGETFDESGDKKEWSQGDRGLGGAKK